MTGFWRFWTEPADVRPLTFFRHGTAVIGLVQLCIMWPYLTWLYGNRGLVQWAIIESSTSSFLPSIAKLALELSTFGIPSNVVVHAVFGLYGAGLVGLLAGRWIRVSAVVALATHSLVVGSGYLTMYGVDTMLHIALFYMCWLPLRSGTGARTAQRTLQLHVSMLYLNTGFAKASGEQWWTGEAIWRALMQPKFAVFDYTWLAEHVGLLQVATISVVVLELAYPIAVWWPRLRGPALLSIAALHVGIGVFMGLWLFSTMMVVLNVSAFGGRYLEVWDRGWVVVRERMVGWIRRRISERGSLWRPAAGSR